MAENTNNRLKPRQLELFALPLATERPEITDDDRQTLGKYLPQWENIAKTDTASRPAIFAQEMAALGIAQRDMARICKIAGVTATTYMPDELVRVSKFDTGFTILQNAFIRRGYLKSLSRVATKTYLVLCMMQDYTEKTCYPSQGYIAQQVGASRQAVISATFELEDAGLIKITRQTLPNKNGGVKKSVNIYEILDIRETPPDQPANVAVSLHRPMSSFSQKTDVKKLQHKPEPLNNDNHHQEKSPDGQNVGGGGLDSSSLDEPATSILEGLTSLGISETPKTRKLAASLSARGILPDVALAECSRKLSETKKTGARNPPGATITHLETWKPPAPVEKQSQPSGTRLVDIDMEY